MATDQDLELARKRGYGKGYAAGRRRLESDDLRAQQRQDERYFWDAAFIAATPSFIEAQGWKQGEKALTSLPERIQLATDWANAALKKRRSHAP